MRIAICVRHQASIYRLVWLNEDKGGIYLGAREDSHVSYHADGTRHVKMGIEYHNRFTDAPIASFTGFKQLDHFALSLTKEWFNPKTLYPGDRRTESSILVDESLLSGKDSLALDTWLTDRSSEQELLATIAHHVLPLAGFVVVSEFGSSLEHFPEHKLFLILRAARYRACDAETLMFPPEA